MKGELSGGSCWLRWKRREKHFVSSNLKVENMKRLRDSDFNHCIFQFTPGFTSHLNNMFYSLQTLWPLSGVSHHYFQWELVSAYFFRCWSNGTEKKYFPHHNSWQSENDFYSIERGPLNLLAVAGFLYMKSTFLQSKHLQISWGQQCFVVTGRVRRASVICAE